MRAIFAVLIAGSVAAALKWQAIPGRIVSWLVFGAAVLGIANAFFGQTVKEWFDAAIGPLSDATYRRAERRYDRTVIDNQDS